jgi:uncharacterized membrane protein
MNRRPELDLARTLAILMMVAYHFAYDLDAYYGWNIDVLEGPWLIFARTTAILFLLISGISSALSFSRGTNWRKFFKRFATVGGAALLVSLGTYIADPDIFVRFGILHLIAVAGLLLPFVARLKERTIILGIIAIILGMWIHTVRMDTSWLLPIGIRPDPFRSVDYFPLLPWFGVILIGYGLGCWSLRIEQIARKRAQRESAMLNAHRKTMKILGFPGRYSLLIYLVHQPIILGVLWLMLGKPAF